MDIERHLRQLNRISPNPDYVRDSRARLMAASRAPLPKFTFQKFFAGLLQSGFAIALTGILLFVAVGGAGKLLWPLTGLDSSLNAEAQAVDIQIHLADLRYQDAPAGRQDLIAAKSPALRAPAAATELPASTPAESSATSSASLANATSTAPSSTPIGVDEALDILSH